jgi:hypothetical protein
LRYWRKAQYGEEDTTPVGPTALPRRGDDSQRHGDRYGNQQGQDHRRQGRRNALCDHRDDRLPGEQIISKIALQYGEGPGAETDRERLIAPEACSGAGARYDGFVAKFMGVGYSHILAFREPMRRTLSGRPEPVWLRFAASGVGTSGRI